MYDSQQGNDSKKYFWFLVSNKLKEEVHFMLLKVNIIQQKALVKVKQRIQMEEQF